MPKDNDNTRNPFLDGQELPPNPVELAGWLVDWIMAHPEDKDARRDVARVLDTLAEVDGMPEPLQGFTWADFGDPPPQPWAIPDWLPSGAVTLLSGPPGVGKSRLTLQLAAGVAGGAEGGGWIEGTALSLDHRLATEGKTPVVFASWEDRPAVVFRTLASLSGSARPWVRPDIPLLLPGNDKVNGIAARGPLYEARSRYQPGNITDLTWQLQEYATEQGAALVVLDSLAAVYASNENDRAEVRSFLSCWDAWAYQQDCAVLVLSHPPKSAADYSGSTDWLAGARSMWTLTKEPRGKLPKRGEEDNRPMGWKLACPKSNYAEEGPPEALRLEWDGPAFRVAGPWSNRLEDVAQDMGPDNGEGEANGLGE